VRRSSSRLGALGPVSGFIADERERLKALEREDRELRRARRSCASRPTAKPKGSIRFAPCGRWPRRATTKHKARQATAAGPAPVRQDRQIERVWDETFHVYGVRKV
jgi:hypothetical protein